jgi:hypothetical protein
MKFIATVPLNDLQKEESQRMNGKMAEAARFIFDFRLLLENPPFSIREILIPWLRAGNYPELLDKDDPQYKSKYIWENK